MYVCMAKSAGFESSVNKDFQKETAVLIQRKKIKAIFFSNCECSALVTLISCVSLLGPVL
jgi:hypothetical protein